MYKTILTSLLLWMMLDCSAQQIPNHKSLDTRNPVIFGGDYIVFQGKTIKLGPKALYIDGQFSDAEAAKYPYVFNSVNKAAEHLSGGTEASPMVLYIAPWVYWIDNPDDPEIRKAINGAGPYGLIIKCEWLRLYGLSDNAENVVLACNRGQTIGSQGNFTMFRFYGDGTSSENITFGNYCNVDLIYPLKPALGREKRASAIVQAQLIFCDGDKIVARNTRFISRLNLCPFVGGRRVLFDRCHFECTDDALCATGVYLNSSFEFYSSKPFYATTGTGVVLLNCVIRSFTRGSQFFTKGNGQVAVLDTRLVSETMTYLGWREIVPEETRNYQFNMSLNGKKINISKNDPETTIDMEGKTLLDAYRFLYDGKVTYNTYNLLCGNDDWDPMGIKDIVISAEKTSGKKYTMLPVQIIIGPIVKGTAENENNRSNAGQMAQFFNPPGRITLETKKDDVRLIARLFRFSNCELKGEKLLWSISPEDKSFAELKVSSDSMSCDVIPENYENEQKQVVITATTPSGLEGVFIVNVAPSKLPPPQFSSLPGIIMQKTGNLHADYKLNMEFEDQSLVTWYRCRDPKGSNPFEVAVSRFNKPMLDYELTAGDIGYYMKINVEPKHVRCDPGNPVSAIMDRPISEKDVIANAKVLSTDFRNISTKNQPEVQPGFWTMCTIEQSADSTMVVSSAGVDAWHFGEGTEGSAGQVGLLQGRFARMLFTPVGTNFRDMKLAMTVTPSKTAGQGFSIAHLYMDVLIKFDNKTMSGYALRFIRTIKYGDAVDCMFVRYDNGKVTPISKSVSTGCYRPSCNITLEVRGNKIIAHAEPTKEYYIVPDRPGVVKEVNIETEIFPNKSGGFGIQYVGGASTMINKLKMEWE